MYKQRYFVFTTGLNGSSETYQSIFNALNILIVIPDKLEKLNEYSLIFRRLII